MDPTSKMFSDSFDSAEFVKKLFANSIECYSAAQFLLSNEIVLAEYAESHRAFVEKWHKKDPNIGGSGGGGISDT